MANTYQYEIKRRIAQLSLEGFSAAQIMRRLNGQGYHIKSRQLVRYHLRALQDKQRKEDDATNP